MIRLILRYLANNEQLVKRLSESYPVQSAARLVASIFFKGKNVIEEHDLKKRLNPENLQKTMRKFTQDVKDEIENIKSKKH